MASKSEGKARSSSRKRSAVVCIRMLPDQKHHYRRIADKRGYPGFSAFVLDALETADGEPSRLQRVTIGWLGSFAEKVKNLAELRDPVARKNASEAIDRAILAFQRDLARRTEK